jgi:Kef-type K+ transport system membrane component KefB
MAVILAIAAGIVGVLLKQPLQIAFIAAGILAGPGMLALIRSAGHLNVLADICLAVLLFMIGLKLDLHLIRSPGRISAATGLGQVVFTASAEFAICLALGIDS